MEIWEDVIGFEGLYQVSNMGHVKSFHRDKIHGQILKPISHSGGYLWVNLSRDGEQWHKYVHRLVAEAFLGQAPPGYEVNHKNGDKADNRAKNLEWVTHSKNGLHAHRVLGREAPKGEGVGTSKLTDEKVVEIRRLYNIREHTQRELGRMFGVTREEIWRIVHHKLWQHVP